MRKRLLLILLSMCFSGFAQSELYVLEYIPQNNSGGTSGCRLGDYRDGYTITYRQGKYSLTANTSNIKIDYREGYNDDPSFGCGGPCGFYQEYCDGVEYESTFSHFDGYYKTYSGPDPIECGSNDCFPISYHAVLLPKITAPFDRRCENQELFDQYSDGINHNVTGLVWEYLNTSNVWTELPNFKNRFPLNVSLLNIFGANWRTKFNGNLQLRFKFTAPFTSSVLYSFSTYTVQLTECSPELTINPPITTPTLCSYTNDGGFTMTVDRDLVTNEKLIISLYKENDLVPNTFDFLTQENTTVLQDNGNGTYSYTWQGDLAPIRYQIKFQTLLGSGGIPNTDPSWASLNYSSPFKILEAVNVNFTATHLNDENCFALGDGKIELNITSGETSTYKYIIYKVEGTSETIYRNWTTFSGNNTIIENLEKNKYRIKVQDSKNCFARNP